MSFTHFRRSISTCHGPDCKCNGDYCEIKKFLERLEKFESEVLGK